MALWVRNGTGSYPSNLDVAVTGTMELDNGTAPGAFDPAAVNSVRIQYDMEVVSGTFISPEDHTVLRTVELTLNGVGTAMASISGTPTDLDNGTSPISTDETDSSIGTGFSTAEWEGGELNPTDVAAVRNWTTYNQDMAKDGVTIAVASSPNVIVTIDYTPSSGDATAVLTALVVSGTFDATQVSATTQAVALVASATFDPVITANEVNATIVLTSLVVNGTFDPAVAVGEVNATIVLTVLVVSSTFDAATVTTTSSNILVPFASMIG